MAKIKGSQSNVLTLTSVTMSNAGTYQVVVDDPYGSTNDLVSARIAHRDARECEDIALRSFNLAIVRQIRLVEQPLVDQRRIPRGHYRDLGSGSHHDCLVSRWADNLRLRERYAHVIKAN